MPRRRLHEPHAAVGDLRGERLPEADRIRWVGLDGHDEARSTLQRDSGKGAEMCSHIDDHVAVANRDCALLVDVANRLLERKQIELASIPCVPPEPPQWRLPQN